MVAASISCCQVILARLLLSACFLPCSASEAVIVPKQAAEPLLPQQPSRKATDDAGRPQPLHEPLRFVSSVNLADDAADFKWLRKLQPDSQGDPSKSQDRPRSSEGIDLQASAIRTHSFAR